MIGASVLIKIKQLIDFPHKFQEMLLNIHSKNSIFALMLLSKVPA